MPRPAATRPPSELRIMSAGQRMEIFKAAALPSDSRASASPTCRAATPSATRAWPPRARSRPSTRIRSPPASTFAWCTTARCRTTTACAGAEARGHPLPNRQRHRSGRRLPDVAPARGRGPERGARGDAWAISTASTPSPSAPRRLALARSDRLQAGGARRDRRLGGNGDGIPGDRHLPGAEHAKCGSPLPATVHDGSGNGLMSTQTEPAVEIIALAQAPLRELNARFTVCGLIRNERSWRIPPTPAAPRHRGRLDPRLKSRSTDTSAITAPA